MFFAPFDEIQRSEQQTFKQFRSKLTLGYKLIFFISFVFMIHNIFTTTGFIFANIPTVTFTNNQFWRILTAPLATLQGMYGVISLTISFWWLTSLLPNYERKYSTIHLLTEVFLQNLLIQITYCVIVTLLVRNSTIYETYNDYFYSIGWTPIIIIWIFKFTGQNKEQKINFCFLPCLVKNKYLAWIVSVTMILLTIQKTPLIVATLLGAIQFHLFNRSCIRLPIGCLKVLQFPLRIFSRCCWSFISLASVEDNLRNLYERKGVYLQNQSVQEGSEMFTDTDIKGNNQFKKRASEIEMVRQENIVQENLNEEITK